MKIKDGFVKQEIGGKWLAVATGELSRTFHGMIELNETAAVIWDALEAGQSPEAIVDTIAALYGISRDKADADVHALLSQMADEGILDE